MAKGTDKETVENNFNEIVQAMARLGVVSIKLDCNFRVVKITYTGVPTNIVEETPETIMDPANISAMPPRIRDFASIYDDPDLWPGGEKPELKTAERKVKGD